MFYVCLPQSKIIKIACFVPFTVWINTMPSIDYRVNEISSQFKLGPGAIIYMIDIGNSLKKQLQTCCIKTARHAR